MEARLKTSKAGTQRHFSSTKLMAAASSPTPDAMGAFNACGHEGCHEGGCKVRYVGPVSHLRDHHALHAARGVVHVWTAAIVSGLAVVITGFLAYGAVQARTVAPPVVRGPSPEMLAITQRLDRMEEMMRTTIERCTPPDNDQPGDQGGPGDDNGPPLTDQPLNQGHPGIRRDNPNDMPPPTRDNAPLGGDRRSPPPIPPPVIPPPPVTRANGGAPAIGGGAAAGEVRP